MSEEPITIPSPPQRNGQDREATPELKPRSRPGRSEYGDESDAPPRRHREREDETPEERELRRKLRRENETEEERAERHKRRRERERERERDRDGLKDGERSRGDESATGERERKRSRRERSGSRDSYRSHRSHRSSVRGSDDRRVRDREYDDGHRLMDDRRRRDYEDRDRRYYDDRRRDPYPHSPMRGDRYAPSPPRRRRGSPEYSPQSGMRPMRSPSPPPPRRDEADALLDSVDSETRSVFVSQLAAALTSRDLGMFFEDKLGRGSVRDARVVTDRVTRRSKGIAYVELSSVELVPRAIALTGTIVMGLPIMITFTESTARNNAAPNTVSLDAMLAGSSVIRPAIPGAGLALPSLQVRDANADAVVPYHRLYVGNLYYNLTSEEIRQVFEPFGELEFVDMPMEPQTNRSRGYAFVQYKELRPAQMALEAMNGFELAGRQIKVATVHPKGSGPAAAPAQPGQPQMFVPSSGDGNRPPTDLDDREGTRMDATARQQLMYKLARQADPAAPKPVFTAPKLNLPTQQTHYVQVTNMFDPAEETEPNWHLDLEEDIKEEVEAKYGKLDKIFVDKNSSDGNVFMKFADLEGSSKAVAGLNGRFFASKRISAAFMGEVLFKAAVPN